VALKRIARVRAEQRVEEMASGEGSWTDVAAQHPPSHGRSGGLAAGSSTETAHGVIIPLSASERRLILEATDLERAVAERLRELDGQGGGVRLTISQLVKLAIATSGVPTRPTSKMDRKKLDRLSGRIHDVVASCLMAERPRRRRVTSPDLPPEGKDDER